MTAHHLPRTPYTPCKHTHDVIRCLSRSGKKKLQGVRKGRKRPCRDTVHELLSTRSSSGSHERRGSKRVPDALSLSGGRAGGAAQAFLYQ